MDNAQLILVTGGTGTLGKLIVSQLRAAGRKVRVLSRHKQESNGGVEFVTGDLGTGEGVEDAVKGAAIIVHCAGSGKGDDVKAENLVKAARQAGARHLVYISVVGADRIPMSSGIDRAMFGYFASKLAAEHTIAGSGIPWTILRATQFQELTFTVVQGMAKMPLIAVPAGFSFQPIAAEEVANRLTELALGEPAGRVLDMGGPRAYLMEDLVREYLKAAHKRRPIMRMPMPGKAARAFKEGANLAPDRAVGRRTWEEFLRVKLGSNGA